MKKTIGKILKSLMILAVVAGLSYGGYSYVQAGNQTQTGSEPSYTRISASTGSLSQQVSSTGSLTIPDVTQIKAPVDISPQEVLVQAGDQVSRGDPILSLDTQALGQTVKDLETSIAALDSEILSLASRQSDTASISAGASGRVKAIYAKAGESIAEVMARDGGLALLSLDGLMKVDIPAQAGVGIGDSYTIQYGSLQYTGTVSAADAQSMRITFSDSKVLPGDEVKVISGSAIVAGAQAEVNLPYLVASFLQGQIKSVPAAINGVTSRSTRLIELSNLAFSDDYLQKVEERADRWEQLSQAKALLQDPFVYAQEPGIVSELGAMNGQMALKDETLVSLYVGSSFDMTVTVDELDITKVKKDQQATLVMDALPGSIYQAQVSRISQLGQSSGGITGYQVTLKVKGDNQLKLGMNGTATILTGEQQNALLIPLSALQSDKQGSYVWLYQEGYEASKEAPGVKTYVTTGLSDTDYVTIQSGLGQGDEVLVVRTAATGTEGQEMNFTMPGGMGLPAEGMMQPGDQTTRQRQDGGGAFPGGGGSFPGGGTAPGGNP